MSTVDIVFIARAQIALLIEIKKIPAFVKSKQNTELEIELCVRRTLMLNNLK